MNPSEIRLDAKSGVPPKYRERYIGAKLGPLSILFGLSPAKGPRPLPRPTLSDSAHEVVSEDGFSLLVRPPARLLSYLFPPLFFLFLEERRTNRFHGSFQFPPLSFSHSEKKEGGSVRASCRRRAPRQLRSVDAGLGILLQCLQESKSSL